MSNRLVLVDDTNPNIQYTGPWFIAQNTQLDIGNEGPPFQNTLHGVNINASFSYSFSGSQVIVLGTSLTTNSSGTQDPTWECFVDNISIGWQISEPENNWILCQSELHLQDGPHVLSVNVTVSHLQTFWFDLIRYLPSSNVSLENSTVRVDSSDPEVLYSSGWTESDGISNSTQTPGSTVTYQFFGVSLSWFGIIPFNFSLTPTSAIYSVDGQTPISFFVPALSSANALPLYNQVFFKTETLSPGQHKLIVTYQGNSGTAPLELDYFVVQNASATSALSSTSVPSATSATSSSVLSSSSSNSTSNLGSMKSPPAGIIAGVVGGVIVLVLFLLLYIGRRNDWRTRSLKSPQYYTSEVPSLIPLSFSSKFSPRREPVNVPRATPLPGPVGGAEIDPTNPAIRNTETIPSTQPSTSAQGGNLELSHHADSGVRMPHAEGNRDELPPVYTSG